MAWERYLLNEFVWDFLEAQDLGKEFHYSYILLLLTMILWKPPQDHKYDIVGMKCFTSPKFLELQHNTDEKLWATINALF
jgi:hypothetical protein